jgi:ABC-type branched-chain amino acid transport systems, ATPase component
MEILELKGVSKRFGGIIAVENVTITIMEGEIYGLIGPNGAGKTTLLNLISGIYAPDEGEIVFNGVRISNRPPYSDAYKQMVRTFQIPKLWKKLDVYSNLIIAGYAKAKKRDSGEIRREALNILRFLGLEHAINMPAGKLSGGQAKLLEFGRALMCNPKLLMLDEPFAGVSPAIMQKQIEFLKMIKKERGVSVLIVSHIISKLVEIVNRVGVMHAGRLIAEGVPSEVLVDKAVIEAYMGGSNVPES